MANYEGDEVLEEQFTRNVQFFGSEGQRRAARAFVVVIGLGVRYSFPTTTQAWHASHQSGGMVLNSIAATGGLTALVLRLHS